MDKASDSRPVNGSERRRVDERVAALVTALNARGLAGKADKDGAVLAANPAGEPDGGDPRGRAMSPGLRQEVRCLRNARDGGRLWWYWAWAGPTRQSPADLEPLCPAADAEIAADRIAKVLAVPSADATRHGGLRDDE
ncbi:hypothetical protein Arub01_37810 [Actinomadura rubrobrunea]|uniref:Uncharacterized protein n=1 Tax=Actinomadura rubrobrunea TaxID=115335 RepID=A0A9W6UXR9_9ACTN|nr:hypothetical protein [Actinomadura rubrobrunea]GLW65537.1 hypothetical protein Arub01_37810 [Actinomadura rubrobrunea]